MKYRVLGKTGIEVSEIGFGAWSLGSHWGVQKDNDSFEALNTAIDKGVNLIDTAAAYGNGKGEQVVGNFVKSRSEQIYVCTKTPPMDGPWPPSPYCDSEDRYPEEYLRSNLKERCEMLGTDCVDILLLHTWTRAWNRNPLPFKYLQKLKQEGLVKYVGLSTPEHDQNSAIDLMRSGLIDVVEVVYNIFEQGPAAQFLDEAEEYNVGIIGRVALDEGSLSGKFTKDTAFPDGDFRKDYFSGDRLSRTVERVERIRRDVESVDMSMAEIAIKFALSQKNIHSVVSGMRNKFQAESNTGVSDLPDLPAEVLKNLQQHDWPKGFWYLG